MQAGQALPLMLAVGVILLAGAVALFTLGRVHLSGAQAQSAADLAALSAARELRAGLGQASLEGEEGAARIEARLRAAADEVATPMGARVETVRFADDTWPPLAVDVAVSQPTAGGMRVRAVARAGIALATEPVDGRTGWATGGGYSGPLVYRDGKPMCPAVAAAFDLMDGAARAQGIDLVVNSGFRSDAEQAILFARHPDPRWVAPPGRSRHRDATELDINMGDGGRAHAWLRANGGRFGFVQRYSWEPWHWGYIPGCAGNRPAGAPGAAMGMPGWVPARYRPLVVSAAIGAGVSPALLAALLQAESGFRRDAVSPAGAQGIAQFMPATARGVGLADPFDPELAIPAAARLLAGHQRDFGSIPLALAAYNAGPGAVRAHGGVPPYPETRAYVAKVIALAGGAAALGGGPAGDGVVLMRVDGRAV
jgi:hypothetical protein